MSRVLLALLLTVHVVDFAQCAEPPKEIDCPTVIGEHLALVMEGKGDKAVELLFSFMPEGKGLTPDARDTLKKRYAVMYGAGGKGLSVELVGRKQITSRIVRYYAVTHFEKFAVAHVYSFVKGVDDQWKMTNYISYDGVEELEKITPLIPTVRKP